MTYREYIQSDAWRSKRHQRLVVAGFKCEHCGSSDRMQVHHLTYARIGNEKLKDLMALCDRCHLTIESVIAARGHSRKGKPENLRNFTHRRLRMAGIQMIGGPNHKQESLQKWAKNTRPAIDNFLEKKRNPSLQPKSGNHALRGVSPDVQGNNGGKDHAVKPRAEQKAEKGCQRNAIGGYSLQDHERPKRKATSRIMAQGGETSGDNGGGVTPAMRG